MRRFFIACLLGLSLTASAQRVTSVMVNSNGVVVAPQNFFASNGFGSGVTLVMTNSVGSGIVSDQYGNTFLGESLTVFPGVADYLPAMVSFGATNGPGGHVYATSSLYSGITFTNGVLSIFGYGTTVGAQVDGQWTNAVLSVGPGFLTVTGNQTNTGAAVFGGNVTVLNTAGGRLIGDASGLTNFSATTESTNFPAGFQADSFNVTNAGTVRANLAVRSLNAQILLSANTNLVDGAPYSARALVGTTNWGPVAGMTNVWWIMTNHTSRVRNAPVGNVMGFTFWVGPTNGLLSVQGDVWKRNSTGTNYDLWGSGPNLWPLTPNSVNIFTLPNCISNVTEGDFIGGHAVYAAGGATVQNFFATNGVTGFSFTNSSPRPLNEPWSTNVLQPSLVPIEFLFQAPLLLVIGDSLSSGVNASAGYADTVNAFGLDGNQAQSMATTVARGLGVSMQNMSISGQGGIGVLGQFPNDVTPYHPQYVFTDEPGNNDLPSTPTNTMAAYAIDFINLAVGIGAIPIMSTINPAWLSSDCNTLNEFTNMVWFNQYLYSLTNLYPNLIIVDANPMLGQFVPGGPVGNLGQLQAQYNNSGDHIHLMSYGQARWAKGVMKAVVPVLFYGEVRAGTIGLSGDMEIDGSATRTIGMARQTAYGGGGSNLVFQAGGSAPFSTNQGGGTVIIQGGVTTGNGTSDVQIWTPTVGSSGTNDGVYAEHFDFIQGSARNDLVIMADSGTASDALFKIGGVYGGGVGDDGTSVGIINSKSTGVAAGFDLSTGTNFSVQGAVLASGPVSGTAANLTKIITSMSTGIIGTNSHPSSDNSTFYVQATNLAVNPFDYNSSILTYADNSALYRVWMGFDTNTGMATMGAVKLGTSHNPISFDLHNAGATFGSPSGTIDQTSPASGYKYCFWQNTFYNGGILGSNGMTLGAGGLLVQAGGQNITGASTFNGNIIGAATAPTVVTNGGSGISGATVSVSGSALSGTITINTGLTPSTSAQVITGTYAVAFPNGSTVILTPASATVVGLALPLYVSSQIASGFVVSASTAGLAGSTTYVYNYLITGK